VKVRTKNGKTKNNMALLVKSCWTKWCIFCNQKLTGKYPIESVIYLLIQHVKFNISKNSPVHNASIKAYLLITNLISVMIEILFFTYYEIFLIVC
jgi:hypothetical protein